MSFDKLPAEIKSKIFDDAVPQDWDTIKGCHKSSALRLVSKQFDHLCSPHLVDKLKKNENGDYAFDRNRVLSRDTMVWMLTNIYQLPKCHHLLPVQMARDVAMHICHWKEAQSVKLDFDALLKAACYALLVEKGLVWVCIELEKGNGGQPTPMGPKAPEDAEAMRQILRSSGCLHTCAALGDSALVEGLLKEGVDPNSRDESFGLALHTAICAGHLDAVATLVRAGADIHMYAGNVRSPLEAAAWHGHIDIVRYLLTQDADIRYAIGESLESHRSDILDVLLASGRANVNNRRNCYSAPIAIAVRNGMWSAMQTLLSRPELQLDRIYVRDNISLLPWLIACRLSQQTLEVLSHPNVSTHCHEGASPLVYACMCGLCDVAEVLMTRFHMSPNGDQSGDHPLSVAILHGQPAIVRLLLSQDSLDVTHGRPTTTPLLIAVERGDRATLRLMLDRPEVRANPAMATTVFRAAVSSADADMVRLVMSRYAIDVNALDENDRHVLHDAIDSGVPAVQLALSIPGLDPEFPDRSKENPLAQATIDRKLAITGLLLQRTTICVPVQHRYTRSEYVMTAQSIREVALLSNSYVSGPATPQFGGFGFAVTMEMDLPFRLREERYLASDFTDRDTGMSRAVHSHFFDNARSLTEHPCWYLVADYKRHDRHTRVSCMVVHCYMDPEVAGPFGWTPMMVAAERGWDRVVDVMVAHSCSDPNLADTTGVTPLLAAIQHGHPHVVKQLLKDSRIDVDQSKYDGETPLAMARRLQQTDIVRMIHEHKALHDN